MYNIVNAKNLKDFLEKEVGLTDWIEIDQDRINKFAEATGDFQYIHVDKDIISNLVNIEPSSNEDRYQTTAHATASSHARIAHTY